MHINHKKIRSILLVLLILSMVTVLFSACGSRDKKTDAWVCAQDVVERNLKAPASAKFCSYREATITDLGDDTYRIEGYVDAQNSFGAMIRSRFSVTLTLTEKGYKNATCSIR